MAFVKCINCNKMFNSEKAAKKHNCMPAIGNLGTNKMRRLRGSHLGKQVDGNIELAYLRGYDKGYADGRAKRKSKP